MHQTSNRSLHPFQQLSNDSERDEDSEDTASRTESVSGSHTDINTGDVPDSSVMREFTQPYEPVYEKPWGAGRASPSPVRQVPPHSPHSPRTSQRPHQFIIKSFQSPYKCNLCSSLLVGLQRQGITCESEQPPPLSPACFVCWWCAKKETDIPQTLKVRENHAQHLEALENCCACLVGCCYNNNTRFLASCFCFINLNAVTFLDLPLVLSLSCCSRSYLRLVINVHSVLFFVERGFNFAGIF